jgi:hypothetical protein
MHVGLLHTEVYLIYLNPPFHGGGGTISLWVVQTPQANWPGNLVLVNAQVADIRFLSTVLAINPVFRRTGSRLEPSRPSQCQGAGPQTLGDLPYTPAARTYCIPPPAVDSKLQLTVPHISPNLIFRAWITLPNVSSCEPVQQAPTAA